MLWEQKTRYHSSWQLEPLRFDIGFIFVYIITLQPAHIRRQNRQTVP